MIKCATSLVIAILSVLMALNLLAMMFLTVVDVVGRYFFNRPVPGANEIIELMLAVLVFGTLPLATARNEHILIDILDFLIKGAAKRIQQVLVNFLGALLCGMMGWQLWRRADELASYSDVSTFLHIPLPPFAYAMSSLSWLSAATLLVLSAAALLGTASPFDVSRADLAAEKQGGT